MKPTPRKLALMMSAVGLGLSLPGAALGQWGVDPEPDSASTLGLTATRAQAFQAFGFGGLANCGPAGGDAWLRATATLGDTSSLAQRPRTSRAVAASGSDRPPSLATPAPRPEAAGATPTRESADRDREADAIAMVLTADPPSRSDEPTPVAFAAAEVAAGGPGQLVASAPVQTPDASAGSSTDATDATDPGSPLRERVPDTDTGAPPLPSESITASGLQDGSPAVPTPAVQTSTERVLSSLGEFSGSRSGLRDGRDAAQELDLLADGPVAFPVLERERAGSPIPVDAAGDAGKAAGPRLNAAPEIVVASHGDKVLMSLAALRSDDGPESGRFGAQTKETVVVQHADKVLLTLASLVPESTRKRARFAAPSPAERVQDQPPSASADDGGSAAAEAASARSTVAVASSAGVGAGQVAVESPATPALQTMTDPVLPDVPAMREPAGRNPIGADAVALSVDKLDGVRGGFVTDSGLQISFGIERAVYLNGNLVTTTSLNLADLGKISAGQAQPVIVGAGGLTLIQNGPGNTFLPGTISSSSVGTVIQNTLDNQKIQTITRIDAAVNAAEILRAINLQSSLRNAVTDSLRR